jgi:hypothetical protein
MELMAHFVAASLSDHCKLVQMMLKPADGSGAEVPGDEFWEWAARQLALSPEQVCEGWACACVGWACVCEGRACVCEGLVVVLV